MKDIRSAGIHTTKFSRHRHQSQTMPPAPIPQQMPAMTSRSMCFTVCRISVAVWEAETSELVSRDWMEVKVPGKITKPARRIQVKNDASMLCRRGIVSSARSMFM